MIELTGQEQRMTTTLFFTLDKNGSFLITTRAQKQINIICITKIFEIGEGASRVTNISNIICVFKVFL